ncbi:MAG: class I SAM-dependent methyltransferase [Pseudomonadales bacterium]|jgi:SAM-dependent methyltransferase|nr:class I SAM-dependent methyltransferase [Pseudomonadales bacterium]
MVDAERFDDRYYERFYLGTASRARVAAHASRTADLLYGAARYYEVPVRRVVDLGAGTGRLLRAIGRRFPSATLVGVERSPWAARRYGWVECSLLDFEDAAGFDLVVCNDVLQYLDDRDAGRAIERIASLCRGLAYVTAVTDRDRAGIWDPEHSDPAGHFRSAAFYRRRLARRFIDVGSGVHLEAGTDAPVWELERR